jgi:hypothetical protein
MADISNSKPKRHQSQVVWGTAIVIMVVVHILLLPDTWLGLLVSVPLVALAYYLVALPKRRTQINGWFVDYALPAAVWGSAWIILVCLVLWLLVTLWLAPPFNEHTTAVLLNETGVYVTVEVERAIAADGRPTNLTFTLYNRSTMTQTITMSTVAGESLRFLTPPLLPDISLSPKSVLTQTITVANTAPERRLRTTETLSVTTLLATGETNSELLNLVAEGTRGLRLRQFVNSTIQRNNPLIIIVAFFIPAFIQLMQYYIKEEQRKQATKKKEEEEEHKEQSEAHMRKVRQAILAENFEKAAELLDQRPESPNGRANGVT